MSSLSLPSVAAKLALPRWLPLLVIGVLAVILRHGAIPNCDVSWGLTMADKVLDGQRLYVDIIEVNPPATAFLYIAPALLGRLTGVPAEFFIDALVFLAAGLSLWLSARILRRSEIVCGDGWTLASVAAAALLILPMHCFGEREHIALIAFLPLLAIGMVRAKGDRADRSLATAAGICGGIIAIIKPHFAVPIVVTAAVAALHARSWRPFFALENWIAAGLFAAYLVLVAIAYPQFISDILPVVMTVYVPAKISYLKMLVDVATPLWLVAIFVLALLKRRELLAPPFSLLLAGSIGFLFAFYVQRKGWSYQSYPMLALALIALALALIEQWRRETFPPSAGRWSRLASACSTALTVAVALVWMNLGIIAFNPTALAAAVRTVAPHPKIIALSTHLWVDFPLTRMVGGTWVGRAAPLWVIGDVVYRRQTQTLDPQTDARLEAYGARDRTMLTEDIARNRPDVILVDHRDDTDWIPWAKAYPPLAAQMSHYQLYRSVDRIDILRRDADR